MVPGAEGVSRRRRPPQAFTGRPERTVKHGRFAVNGQPMVAVETATSSRGRIVRRVALQFPYAFAILAAMPPINPTSVSPAAPTVGSAAATHAGDPAPGLREVSLALRSHTLPGRGMAVSTLDRASATASQWSVRVDTRALLDLRDRGVDLAALPMMLHAEYANHRVGGGGTYTTSLEVAASGLPDPAAGALELQCHRRYSDRSATVTTTSTPGKGVLDDLSFMESGSEVRLVWRDPESGQRRPLLVVEASRRPDRNTSLTLHDLLHAASESLGEPVRPAAYRDLPTSGVTAAIDDALRDHVVVPEEVAAIQAEAERGGVTPSKLSPVLDLYEKAAVATWAKASADGATPGAPIPTLTLHAGTKLRDYLLGHQSMLPADRIGDGRVDIDRIPLPAPSVRPDAAVSYSYGERTEGHVVDARHVQARVEGGGLVVDLGDLGEIKFKSAQVGVEVRDGMTTGFGSIGANKYKIHDIRIGTNGLVERLAVTWVAEGVGGHGMRFGARAGHVVFDKTPTSDS